MVDVDSCLKYWKSCCVEEVDGGCCDWVGLMDVVEMVDDVVRCWSSAKDGWFGSCLDSDCFDQVVDVGCCCWNCH